jgi:mRNA interferase RelE/StbE
MKYAVVIEKPVIKYIEKLPTDIYSKIKAAILALEDNPRPHGVEKLTNKDAYRIRVGVYRIIYTIKDKVLLVTVIDAGHRREIYKK